MALERLTQITEVGIQSGITLRNVNVEGAYVSGVVTATSLNVTGGGANFSGVVTAISFNGNVTGNITPSGLVVSGVSTFQASSFWGDGDVAYFGDGQDLLIFHNSTDSIIRDNGTGDLYIEGGNRIRLTNPTALETYAVFNQDGASELYHDNVKRLETSGIGVSITSALTVGTGASVSSPATNVLTLGTNNVERVRVDSGGNLGIGTTNPIGVLAVSGGVSNPTITFQNGSATNTASDAAVGSIVGYSRTTGGNINIGSVDIRTDTDSASSGAVRILTASNGSLAERFRITSSGKTGINNTNPLSTLSVGTRTSDISDSSLIFTAGGSSNGGEVLAATFCNTAAGASNNATAISFTCRSGDSQTAKIVAMQPSGASSPNTQLDFYVYGSSGSTKIVTFDQNGRVTAPYQPAFKIGVNSRTATGSNRILSTDAGDSFLTDRDYFNTGNHFNGSNGRFTAPVTGTYMFIFSFMRANASGSEIDVRIQKNSTGISANMYARAYASAYTSNYQQSIIVTTTKLNVNDWVNVSITGSTSVYNDDTYFAGHLMY